MQSSFLQKQRKSAHFRRGHESSPDAPVTGGVGGGRDAHADMVGHIAAHLLSAAAAAASGREIQRLDEAEAPQSAEGFEPPQVSDAALGVNGQR